MYGQGCIDKSCTDKTLYTRRDAAKAASREGSSFPKNLRVTIV